MRIIIPMAGMGKRLRPHTLTVPKPLISIAGKPIVEHLVEEIIKTTDGEKIEEIAFIIGNFGDEVEKMLLNELILPFKIKEKHKSLEVFTSNVLNIL